MKYVLTGESQSDRIEGGFGVYRQQSGGNYYISVQQVINSLGVQRLKLFGKLNVEQSTLHLSDDCCKSNLSIDELECRNSCIENSSNISKVERASIYYIAGYVAHKEKCMSLDTYCEQK